MTQPVDLSVDFSLIYGLVLRSPHRVRCLRLSRPALTPEAL